MGKGSHAVRWGSPTARRWATHTQRTHTHARTPSRLGLSAGPPPPCVSTQQQHTSAGDHLGRLEKKKKRQHDQYLRCLVCFFIPSWVESYSPPWLFWCSLTVLQRRTVAWRCWRRVEERMEPPKALFSFAVSQLNWNSTTHARILWPHAIIEGRDQ